MDDEANLKRQARRRLIGAVALATAAVVILPMVLDREPKPMGQDIELKIPSPDKAGEFKSKIVLPADMAAASQPAAASAVASASAAAAVPPAPAPAASTPAAPALVAPAPVAVSQATGNKLQAAAKPAESKPIESKPVESKPVEPKPLEPKSVESKPAASKPAAETKAEAKPKAEAPAKPAAKPAEKTAAVPKTGFAVQVGAFSNAAKAASLQQKLHKQGLPAYTEKIGGNVRVRVGPYATRAAAEKELGKLKAQGMKPVLAKLD